MKQRLDPGDRHSPWLQESLSLSGNPGFSHAPPPAHTSLRISAAEPQDKPFLTPPDVHAGLGSSGSTHGM